MIPELTLSKMKILIVDDEPANVALLQYMLISAGYTNLQSTGDSRQAMAMYDSFRPDLVLLDLMMPHVSGFEIMRELGKVVSPDDCLPILVLTADVTAQTKHQALLVGASDFLTKPFDHVEVLLRIRHLLHIRAQHLQLAAHRDHLEDTVAERTTELRLTLSRLEETLHQLRGTQQQVIQHERMSALGSMAAGLAHDFNNALSLILGYSELLLGELVDFPHKERSDEFLNTIITAAQDAAKVFDRLRGFYRQADDGQLLEALDVNSLVEQAVALTRPRWHGQALAQGVNIDLRTDLTPDLPPLVADGTEVREMLTNLIFNAIDATPAPGGTITVCTSFDPGTGGTGPGYILLSVADTGTGMSEETRRRCLEPFFTTKGKRGTGLGLAMVYGTMQRHGGDIDLESTEGVGTRFTLKLPMRVSTTPEPLAPALESGFPWSILLVDDQPDFLKILEGYLAKGGLFVETACGAAEAMEKFSVHPYDIVITDKVMPKMGGEELGRALKVIAPRTKVIILTGYSISEEMTESSSAIDLAINKPVTLAALRAAVGRVMVGIQPGGLPSPTKARRGRRLTVQPGMN